MERHSGQAGVSGMGSCEGCETTCSRQRLPSCPMQAGRRYNSSDRELDPEVHLLVRGGGQHSRGALYQVFQVEWLRIPWQPLSLIGIAVAFYLGFKNNSSYERTWEARKIRVAS